MIGTLIFFLATLSCSRANLDPAPELAALGYVSYTGVDYIPLDDMDPFVTVRVSYGYSLPVFFCWVAEQSSIA